MDHHIGNAPRFELFPNFEHSHKIASESAHLMTSHQDFRQHRNTAESHLPTMHIEGAHSRTADATRHNASRHSGEQHLAHGHSHTRHRSGDTTYAANPEGHHTRSRSHAAAQDTDIDAKAARHPKAANITDTSTVSGGEVKSAVASWYHEGTKTANREPFNPDGLTAASKTLPFGTRLEVTNPANGNHVIVRINDRGPYVQGRSIDLSRGAARQLGMIDQGVAHINYRIL
jgi:rare lipoprotein A